MNECSHSAPLSTLTRNKHSGMVASYHDTGRPRNTYIREDLGCVHMVHLRTDLHTAQCQCWTPSVHAVECTSVMVK